MTVARGVAEKGRTIDLMCLFEFDERVLKGELEVHAEVEDNIREVIKDFAQLVIFSESFVNTYTEEMNKNMASYFIRDWMSKIERLDKFDLANREAFLTYRDKKTGELFSYYGYTHRTHSTLVWGLILDLERRFDIKLEEVSSK